MLGFRGGSGSIGQQARRWCSIVKIRPVLHVLPPLESVDMLASLGSSVSASCLEHELHLFSPLLVKSGLFDFLTSQP